MLREQMRDLLKQSICEVVFQKADGTPRVMRCTLLSSYLPPPNPDAKPRKENLEAVPVWDVEAEGWRSFRVDSVKSFMTIEGDSASGD